MGGRNTKKQRARILLSLLLTLTLLFQSITPGLSLAFAQEDAFPVEESNETTSNVEEEKVQATDGTENTSTEGAQPQEDAQPREDSDPSEGTNEVVEEPIEPSDGESESDKTEENTPPGETSDIPAEEPLPSEEEVPKEPLEEPTEDPKKGGDFVTAPVEGGLIITGWKGTGQSILIPDEIDGTPVVAIGRNAFQRLNLTEITLGKNLKRIEGYAFADNSINKLTIPEGSALEEIQEFAFLDNQLTSFTFPEKLKTLGKGAFSDNLLTSISTNNLIEYIGDYAFSKNKLTDVTLGNSILTFGVGVFSDNGRYVKVHTENTDIPKLEKSPGPYGHVVGAIRVVIKYIDKKTGTELRSPKTVGDDMTDINNIFVLHEEVSLKPDVISNYVIQEEVVFTPDQDLYVVELQYQPIKTPPVIERIKSPEIPVDTPEADVEDLLRSFIKATDLLGEDITDKVVINKGELDLKVPGPYTVNYSVEDKFGNKTEFSLEVMVGTDWMNYPIGGGWVLGDFTYNNDTLTGLSEQGKTKLSAMEAGQKHLVLPPFSPLGERPSIQIIGNNAFASLTIDSVDFSHMKDLIEIKGEAFKSSQIKELLNLNQASKLKIIGYDAFISNRLTQVSFSGLSSLESIAAAAFQYNQLIQVNLSPLTSLVSIGSYAFGYNPLGEITFGALPKLHVISSGAFIDHKAKHLDLSGLTGLELIDSTAFAPRYQGTGILESVNFSNMTSLKRISNSAFRSHNLQSVDLSPLTSLTYIGKEAFWNNRKLSQIKFGTIPLQTIGEDAFSRSVLQEIDLSGLLDLQTIQSSAFSGAGATQIFLPVAREGKAPQLKSIENGAFLSCKISSLEIKDFPALEKIGARAFSYSDNIAEVKLINLPLLSSVGEEAFYQGKVREVHIEDVPLLKELPANVVGNNPGHMDYNGLVVVWVTPKETNTIPSKANYLVNPDMTVSGEWSASDFTYAVAGETSTITGFTETGAGKVAQGKFPVIFPERDKDGILITSIADGAFRASGLREVDLSNMTGLQQIGNLAFNGNRMESLNLKNLINLRHIGLSAFSFNRLTKIDFSDLYHVETMGEKAFSYNSLVAVDLSPMESLKSIERQLFERNEDLTSITFGHHPEITQIGVSAFEKYYSGRRIPYVDLSGMPKLKVIDYSAFNNAGIEKLNLRGLHNLEEIRHRAFSRNKIDGLDLTDLGNLKQLGENSFSSGNALGHLDLSPLKSLTTISKSAFHAAGITSIHFGELPNLTEIRSFAFALNKFGDLDLSGLKNLTVIDTSAFQHNPLKQLKLPMDGKLTTINTGAFSNAHLSKVQIPLSLKSLYSAFRKNTPAMDGVMQLVVLQTPTKNNPNGLKNDITATEGGHVVDPSIVTLRYVDEEGREIKSSEVDYATELVTSPKTYFAPDIGGYLAKESSKVVTYEEGVVEYEVVFEYVKKTYEDLPALGVHINHTNLGSHKKHVGDILTTQVTVDASSAKEDLENVDLVINFDPTYIDQKKIKVPTIPGVVDKVTIEEGVIKIHFNKLQGADYFNIPIEWGFKKDVTPQNQEVTLYTELRDADGNVIVSPPMEEGVAKNPVIAAYYDLPILRKGAPDSDNVYDPKGYLGGLREAGVTAVAEVDGQEVLYIQHPDDVPFYFNISQTTDNETLEREIYQVILKDQLPKYKAYNAETNTIVERTAQFDPKKNPGWVYDEETQTVTYVKNVYGKTVVNPLPSLLLQFPGGIMEQEIVNKVDAELIPQHKPDGEPTILLKDDVMIQLEDSKNPVLPPGYTHFSKKALQKYFYDFIDDKKATFYWNLTLSPSTQEGDYYTKVVFTDRNLDPRLYYESIQLPSRLHVATVKAYNEAGEVIEEGKTVGGTYYFKVRDIHHIDIDMGEQIIKDTPYIIKLATKLRNPETVSFSEVASENVFRNCAEMKAVRYDALNKVNQAIVWPTVCDSMQIKPLGLEIVPVKTQTYPSPGAGQNSVAIGEKGSYELSVYRTMDNRKLEDESKRLELPDFRMVDVLPLGIMLDEPAVELSRAFAQSPGAKFEIQRNYYEGRTAIIFTADKLNPDVDVIAKINTSIDLLMKPGAHTNDVYMSFNQEGSQYSYGKTTEGNDIGDGHSYMHDEVSINILKADYMQARKYIRKVEKSGENFVPTSDWSAHGIKTPESGYFQYMLVIDNNTDNVKTGNIIYDVLPHINDTVMQYNNNKERSARNSQFSNTLLGVEVLGGEYVVSYTKDKINYGNQEAGAYLATLNWTSDITDATAFKVQPAHNDVKLDKREQIIVIVTMQAPADGIGNAGKKAFNSFVRYDDSLPGYFLEANMVYNEIPPPTGTITLVKRDNQNFTKVLQGAEFTLYDRYGKAVAVAVTDEKGVLKLENIPIDDYILEETKAPEGYDGKNAFTIDRGTWLKETNLVNGVYTLNLYSAYNELAPQGKVILEKLDSAGKPLVGVKFRLTLRESLPYKSWEAVTDSEGKLEFTDLSGGRYVLEETNSVGLLVPGGWSRTFRITQENLEVSFVGETGAIVNDKASVSIFKIGLLSALNPELSLASYSQGSGKLLNGPWTFKLTNTSTETEQNITIPDIKGLKIENLTTNVVYTLKEISGPDNTIYQLNKNEYSFMITPQGRLVDEKGNPFPTNDIYFPNEKKAMLGEVAIKKVDGEGNGLAGAEFTLFKFNETLGAYESTEKKITTDSEGKGILSDIEPGSYEIRETKVPAGYLSQGETFRFIVEKTPVEAMENNESYVIGDHVIHRWEYQATNLKLDLDFIKKQPIAEMVSEAEADELLLQHPNGVKVKRGDTPFYDVYIPLAGVTFDLYESIKNSLGQNEDVLIAKDLVTDEEGKLDFRSIENFVLKSDAVYKLIETKTKDNTWVLNTKPVIIDMKEWSQRPGFTGLVSVSQNNFKKKGSVLLSKYDRYTQQRLEGITFTLYKGTLREVKLADGSYDPKRIVSEQVTDANGFASYKDLELGPYVLVETKTLTEQGYYLFEEEFEFVLTPEETHYFASVYNMRDKDYFDLPVKKIWYGDPPNYGDGDHEGLVVNLYKNGKLFASAVLKKETGWKHTFEKLLKKDERGQDYVYTIQEVLPDGYVHQMVGVIGKEGVITDSQGNPLDPGEITLKNYKLFALKVVKKWDDQENNYELRPESIVVQLQRGQLNEQGEYEYSNLGEAVTISADSTGHWEHVFEDLLTHDDNGKPYDYKVVEIQVSGYQAPQYSNTGGVITINNVLDTTQVPVEKIWDDGEDILKLRPKEIVLQLMKDGEPFLDPVKLSANDEGVWKHLFVNLPKVDKEGREYIYTVVETRVPSYADPEYKVNDDGSITVTNTLSTVSIPVEKVWDDQNNKYGLRPESITLQLMRNKEKYLDPVLVKADTDGNWKFIFENLPLLDEDGNKYSYTIEEIKVNAYGEPLYASNEDGSFTITNVLETVDLPVVKFWVDKGNELGLRPEFITLQLKRNGENFLEPVTVKADENGAWKHVFVGLAKYDAQGTPYNYSVVEKQVLYYDEPEYGTVEGALAITNTLSLTSFTATKKWDDFENKYGLRPDSITLQLLQNGVAFGKAVEVKVDEAGNWTHTWTDLPKVDKEGKPYVYTVQELAVPGYDTTVSEDGLTVTNTLKKTSVTAKKLWEDFEDKFGLRPETITLQLLQNGVAFGDPVEVKVDEEGNWTHTWKDLPQLDKEGKPYVYTVQELAVPGYDTTLGEDGLTVTNTLKKTSITAKKLWEDFEDKFGLRPETITLQLLQNGQVFGEAVEVKVNEAGNWTHTWKDLPQLDKEGKPFVYTVQELAVPGYDSTVSEDGLTVTNTLKKTSVTAKKLWEDFEDKYELRPEFIILQLLQNGVAFGEAVEVKVDDQGHWTHTWKDLPQLDKEGKPYVYTVEELAVPGYDTMLSEDGLTVTNILKKTSVTAKKLWEDFEDKFGLRPEFITIQLLQNGQVFGEAVEVKVNEAGNWTHTWKDLPQLDKEGKPYVYTVQELAVPGYDSTVSEDGLTVTNTLKKTSVTAKKLWEDFEDKYELRPEFIILQLLQNGVAFGEAVEVKVDDQGHWTHTWKDLPQLDKEGKPYVYTVEELAVPGYDTTLAEDGLTVTNTLKKTSVTAKKLWEDFEDKFGLRPETITLQLLQNGVAFGEAVEVKVDDQGHWTHTWTDLPLLDKEGKPYVYTVQELAVPGYDTTLAEDGLTVTNTLKKTSVTAKKLWEDFEDKFGLRPETITLQLLQNGVAFGEAVEVKVDDQGHWTHTWKDLPQLDKEGKPYVYTVQELAVPGYDTTLAEDGLTVTNNLKKTSVTAKKLWEDFEDKFGLRPETITLQLLQNGVAFGDPVKVKVNEAGNWTHTWTDLPLLDKEGKPYVYTVQELAVPGYDTTLAEDGLTVTNTLKKTSVTAKKLWEDFEDKFGLRPETITLQLLQNGVAFGDPVEVKVDEAGNWTHTWSDLPEVDQEGKPYVYTVQELAVPGYDTTLAEDGLTVTNTLKKTSVTAKKLWEDFEDKYGLRPDSITLQLLQNGQAFGDSVEVKVDEAGNWTHIWTDLPLLDKEGKPYVYTVQELAVPGYDTTLGEDGLTVTNTLKKTSVTAKKLWEDFEDKYGLRPDSITLQLLQNGVAFGDSVEVKVDEAGNWTHIWSDIPQLDKEGKPYVYTIQELAVPGYYTTLSEDGLTVINTLKKTSVTAKKLWEDFEDKYELRPEFIILQLLQNGVAFGKAVEVKVDDQGHWTHTWKDLPQLDKEGKPYVYTVQELAVPGYETTVSEDGLTVTNTLKKTSITAKKLWEDFEDKYGLRPMFITLQLLQNKEIFGEPVKVKVDGRGNWTHTWSDLPEVDQEGKPYVYTVEELAVPGYDTTVSEDGLTITNILKKTSITAKKLWEDFEDKYGLRPEFIILQLLQNGVAFGEAVEVKVDEEGNWTHTWKDLPEVDKEGKEYKYAVVENKVPHYNNPNYADNGNGSIVVTNTLPTVDIPVMKVWDDQGDKYGLRPESITLQLLQNGVPFLSPVSVKADADGKWEYRFTKLPQMDERGEEYIYRVTEEQVKGYQLPFYGTDPETEMHLITNQLETLDLPIKKVWEDKNDMYKLRPVSIKVQLKQNGHDLLEAVVLSKDTGWAHIFRNLPRYDKEGKPYLYTFEEKPVIGYEVTYREGVIENTLKLKDVIVKKHWQDERDALGLRPKVITLQLLRNGETFLDPVEVKVEKGDVQEVKFTELPLLDTQGVPYIYTVKELKIDQHYEVSYSKDGLTLTNKVIPPKDTPKKPSLPATGQDGDLLASLAILFLGLGIYFTRRRYSH